VVHDDGEAHVVGSVLIEHGNRYDGWNVHEPESPLTVDAERRAEA
jgi:hypothetical protein